MLTEENLKDKLILYAETFQQHMKNKEYVRAKKCYDAAVTVSVVAQLDDQFKKELFGERGERGVILYQGLFREDQVLKAYEQCIRSRQTSEYETYHPLQKNSP